MHPEKIYHLFEIGVKNKQEDYIWPVAGKATTHNKVFIVCDGAGRYSNGGIASKMIGQFMAAKVANIAEHKMSREVIDKLLIEAQHKLITYAWKQRLDTQLATTFSMIILYNQNVFASWCGDSRIYYMRGEEILFQNEAFLPGGNSAPENVFSRGINAGRKIIHTEAKWIQDVQDGDYFLLCSRGITENITEREIRSLVSQNQKTDIDPAGTLRWMTFEKRPDNYSMYLIRVNLGATKKNINDVVTSVREKIRDNLRAISILALTIVGLFVTFLLFRRTRVSAPEAIQKNQKTHPTTVQKEDTIPSAFVVSVPHKTTTAVSPSEVSSRAASAPAVVADSAKSHRENPQPVPQNVNSGLVQTEEKSTHKDLKLTPQKMRSAELMIRITTNESCKLKITNTDLDQVIDWNLSPADNSVIYLKPGKNSIVATSEASNTKTKTYNFDVSPDHVHSPQNLQIVF